MVPSGVSDDLLVSSESFANFHTCAVSPANAATTNSAVMMIPPPKIRMIMSQPNPRTTAKALHRIIQGYTLTISDMIPDTASSAFKFFEIESNMSDAKSRVLMGRHRKLFLRLIRTARTFIRVTNRLEGHFLYITAIGSASNITEASQSGFG
eukprot:04491_2